MGGDDDELDSQDQTAAIMEPLAEPVAKPEVEPTQTQSPQKNTEPLAQVGEKPKKSMPPSTIPVFNSPEYLNPKWIEHRLAQVGIDKLIEEYKGKSDPNLQGDA